MIRKSGYRLSFMVQYDSWIRVNEEHCCVLELRAIAWLRGAELICFPTTRGRNFQL